MYSVDTGSVEQGLSNSVDAGPEEHAHKCRGRALAGASSPQGT